MQKWARMAVRPISNRKAPLRRARLTQFRFKRAPRKAGALKGLGAAVRAWDGMSRLAAPERQRHPALTAPPNRSHTYATW